MQSMHVIGRWVLGKLADTARNSNNLWCALCAITLSFACALKTAFTGVFAKDLYRLKESYFRRLDAQAEILEAEAQIRVADSQKRFAEAVSVASQIDERRYKQAILVIRKNGRRDSKRK